MSLKYVHMVFNFTLAAVCVLIIPVSVLIMNVVVAIQVRRAAIHAAANLGVQPHHHSTSAVPTIMLITTSLIYLLFQTMRGTLFVLWGWALSGRSNFSRKTIYAVQIFFHVTSSVYELIYAYNFYIYLITGKQFRTDLRKLLCRCSTSSSSAPALAHAHGAPAPAVIAAAVDGDDDDVDDDDAEVARGGVRADTAV